MAIGTIFLPLFLVPIWITGGEISIVYVCCIIIALIGVGIWAAKLPSDNNILSSVVQKATSNFNVEYDVFQKEDVAAKENKDMIPILLDLLNSTDSQDIKEIQEIMDFNQLMEE